MSKIQTHAAAPEGEEWFLLGRFWARVVRPGGLLYLGTDRTLTRQPETYERDHIIIEIYDRRHPGAKDLGQFVSAYQAETLAGVEAGGRLALHGGIPEWTMTVEETELLRELAQGLLAGEW